MAHPVQRIAPEDIGFALIEHDLRGHADAEGGASAAGGEQEAAAPFDLEQGPLIRGRLLQLAEEEHVLLVTMHHIVSDGWSIGVLIRELSALYSAFCARGGRSAAAACRCSMPTTRPGSVAGWRARRRGAAGALLEGGADGSACAAGAALPIIRVRHSRILPARWPRCVWMRS